MTTSVQEKKNEIVVLDQATTTRCTSSFMSTFSCNMTIDAHTKEKNEEEILDDYQ